MEEQRVQGEEEEEKMYEWLKVVAWGMAEEAKVCGGGGRREVAVVDRSLRTLARKELAGWRQFGRDGGGKAKQLLAMVELSTCPFRCSLLSAELRAAAFSILFGRCPLR